MKKKFCVVMAAGLLFASLAAHAVEDTYVFDSISRIEHSWNSQTGTRTLLTGVIAGTSVATTVAVPAGTDVTSSRCVRYYDVMLETQGKYSLSVNTITTTVTGSDGLPLTVLQLLKCSLTRIP